MKKILYITTSQLSLNPRLRKSADALSRAGHKVHVLYFHLRPWADEVDELYLTEGLWTAERVGGHPKHQRWHYLISRIQRKLNEWVGRDEKAFCRSSSEIVKRAKQWQPDLVIGHNPGSLTPLTRLQLSLNIPTLFDAEDYHRGELSNDLRKSKKIGELEDRLIPFVTALTAASPLIAEKYQNLFPQKQITTIGNAFPLKYLGREPQMKMTNSPLKVVWFSRVVGLDRGLLEFIRCMNLAIDVEIIFTLVGLCNMEVRKVIENASTQASHSIVFKDPMNESALFQELALHDLGLAIEPGFSVNNDIACSNKICSYPLAGCYMLVSPTSGQKRFLDEFSEVGCLIDFDKPEDVAALLQKLSATTTELLELRKGAWQRASTDLNWEKESENLIQVVNSIFGK